jgi:hypothetical protein
MTLPVDVARVPSLTRSIWSSLAGIWRGSAVPNVPDLYRIRRVGSTAIDYIEQTGAGGMTLLRRVAMLAGVYGAEMPYRDPHTAGPAMWALRQLGREEFEVSVAPVEGSNAWRRALEALAMPSN